MSESFVDRYVRQAREALAGPIGKTIDRAYAAQARKALSDIASGRAVCSHGHPTKRQLGSLVHGGFHWICDDNCPERNR